MAEAASQVAERSGLGRAPPAEDGGFPGPGRCRAQPWLAEDGRGGGRLRHPLYRFSPLRAFSSVPLSVTSLSAFILFPQDLLLAAAFVSDAQYNRNIPFKTSPEAVR